jgi:hypothetical protein
MPFPFRPSRNIDSATASRGGSAISESRIELPLDIPPLVRLLELDPLRP